MAESIHQPAGPVPAAVTKDVKSIRTALEVQLPSKRSDNLLIGTWNIRALGGLTDKWDSSGKDEPKRDWHSLACIAAVLERFDVMAIQESRSETTALFALLDRLGPQYRVVASDTTKGKDGNNERLAYVYDSDRVQPSGLVGEIVLPPDVVTGDVKQFARTPYAAGFVRGTTDFILTTVHVLWGKASADRVGEITAFANWMRDWAERPKDWNHNLLVLGDFNLDRLDNPLFEAFVSTGLGPPTELDRIPRTIFDHPSKPHFYDQIAWFNDPTDPDFPALLDGLTYTNRCGNFDFLPHAFAGLTKTQVSWRLSDHYPLWAEFTV